MKILRPKAVYEKLGCRKTKFDEDYRHHSDDDPYVTGAPGIKRLKPIPLGERNIGYLENEADQLIDRLAALRDEPSPQPTIKPLLRATPRSSALKAAVRLAKTTDPVPP